MKFLVVLVSLLAILASSSISSAAAKPKTSIRISWSRNGQVLGKQVVSPKAADGIHLIWRAAPGVATTPAVVVLTRKGRILARPSLARAGSFDFECWWSYPPLAWGCKWSSSATARGAGLQSVGVPRCSDGMQLFLYGTSFTEAFWTRGGSKMIQLKRITMPPGPSPNAINLNSSKSNAYRCA